MSKLPGSSDSKDVGDRSVTGGGDGWGGGQEGVEVREADRTKKQQLIGVFDPKKKDFLCWTAKGKAPKLQTLKH